MTVNATIYAMMGFAPGDHILGSQTKDAGVTVSSNVATLDTSQSHNYIPNGPDGAAGVTLPGGYTKLAGCVSFNISRCSVAPAATLTKMQSYRLATVAARTTNYKMTEDTSRKWSFTIANTAIPGQYTPTGTHHVMIYVTRVTAGSYYAGWSSSDTLWVSIVIDKSVWFNDAITANASGVSTTNGIESVVPIFGQTTTDANAATYTVDDVCVFASDRANPLGKVTVKEWTFTLSVTPPTGFDQANKSTGTDAAALIDERPPGASGTTDGDYYALIDDGTHLKQQSALANTLLAAGDVLYGVKEMIWNRQSTSSKTSGTDGEMHDGTNALRAGGNVLVSGPSSYAETMFTGGAGLGGGSHFSAMFLTAPDAAAWSGKTNTYLDGCFAGTRMNGASANASMYQDAIVVETAIVLSGDTISALSDPGAGFTTERRRGAVV